MSARKPKKRAPKAKKRPAVAALERERRRARAQRARAGDGAKRPPKPHAKPAPVGRLVVELVPKGSWGDNLHARLPRGRWNELRRACYRVAGDVCEICGGRGPDHPVDAHEIWSYDDKLHVQTLVRLIALCPACHNVKHIGFAIQSGRRDEALAHLARVNGWSKAQAVAHAAAAFKVWRARSEWAWRVDLGGFGEPGTGVAP